VEAIATNAAGAEVAQSSSEVSLESVTPLPIPRMQTPAPLPGDSGGSEIGAHRREILSEKSQVPAPSRARAEPPPPPIHAGEDDEKEEAPKPSAPPDDVRKSTDTGTMVGGYGGASGYAEDPEPMEETPAAELDDLLVDEKPDISAPPPPPPAAMPAPVTIPTPQKPITGKQRRADEPSTGAYTPVPEQEEYQPEPNPLETPAFDNEQTRPHLPRLSQEQREEYERQMQSQNRPMPQQGPVATPVPASEYMPRARTQGAPKSGGFPVWIVIGGLLLLVCLVAVALVAMSGVLR
jgi:hypothetical protein